MSGCPQINQIDFIKQSTGRAVQPNYLYKSIQYVLFQKCNIPVINTS